VPPFLLSILHAYTHIVSISTLLVYRIHSPLSEGCIGKSETLEGSKNGNLQSKLVLLQLELVTFRKQM